MASVADERSAVAHRFLDARRTATALDSYPGELPSRLDDAYAIQDRAIAGLGRPVLGWKVGRIGDPFFQQYKVARLAGPIFDVTTVDRDEVPEMPVFAGGFAAAEAEFLLRLGHAPAEGQTRFSLHDAADLIDAVHVGIEVASSPLGSINDLGPAAIISDFGNNNGLLIGPRIPDWRHSGFQDWRVATLIDGSEVGTGRAAEFPDGAVGSARFLLELLAARGIALRAGQWISSGAVTGVHKAYPGNHVEARFMDDMVIRCSLKPAQGQ